MDTLRISVLCQEILGLAATVVVEAKMSDINGEKGDSQAVQGNRQMGQRALDQIEVRLQQLRVLFQ